MEPRRFAVGDPGGGSVLRWTAATRTTLRLDIRRRLRQRVVAVGSLERVVGRGAGQMRWTGRLGGRGLHAGRYLLVEKTAGCAESRLSFTVVRR